MATGGMIFGLYLALRPKDRNLKCGVWCIVLSLAVFFSGNLTITNLLPISGSFNYTKQIQELSNQVSRITSNIQVQQSQSQTQSMFITNIVQNITQVQQEVADVRVFVTNLYSRTRIERIRPSSPDSAMFVPDQALKDEYGLTLVLAQQPIPASVSVSLISDQGVASLSPVQFAVYKNTLMFSGAKAPDTYRDTTFIVSYVPDPFCGPGDLLRMTNAFPPNVPPPKRMGERILIATNIVPLRVLNSAATH